MIMFSIVFVAVVCFFLPEGWMKKSTVLIPLPSLIKKKCSFIRSFFVAFNSIAQNISIIKLITSSVVKCYATILVQRSDTHWKICTFFDLIHVWNSKTPWKQHRLQASFYVINYITDHVMGFPRVSPNVAQMGCCTSTPECAVGSERLKPEALS